MSFSLAVKTEPYLVRTDKSEAVWRAYKVGGGHYGQLDIKSGEFELDGILLTSGKFVMDMNTIRIDDTESQKLAKHLRSDEFFDTKKYPTAQFVVTESTKIDEKNIAVKGNMTIVGITKPMIINAHVLAQTDDVIIYKAEFDIDRTEYGITYRSSEVGDAFIMDDFRMEIKLVGVHKDGKL